jgi:hypothetical protein
MIKAISPCHQSITYITYIICDAKNTQIEVIFFGKMCFKTKCIRVD